MNQSSLTLESNVKSIATTMYWLSQEAIDLDSYYWNSGASTLVTALASDATPATVTTALNKGEVSAGITLVEAMISFFGNVALSSGWYKYNAFGLINGSDPAGSPLSQDVEQCGIRLKTFGQSCLDLLEDCINAQSLYNSSELAAIISSLSGSTIVFGCSTTKDKLVAGMVLVQQFQNVLNNGTVTTGDYQSTVTNWAQDA